MPTIDQINEALNSAGITTGVDDVRRVWTRQSIADRFAAWHDATGAWPTATDLNPQLGARRGRTTSVALFTTLGMPYVRTVYQHFKSLPAARAYAARRAGRRPS